MDELSVRLGIPWASSQVTRMKPQPQPQSPTRLQRPTRFDDQRTELQRFVFWDTMKTNFSHFLCISARPLLSRLATGVSAVPQASRASLE